MLDKLKELLRINGKLSGLIIDEAADCPSSSMFHSRFRSLLKSYREVGYTPSRDYRYLKINRALRRTHADLVEQTIAEIERLGGAVSRIPENDLLYINQEFFVSLVLARCRITDAGTKRWFIRFDSSLALLLCSSSRFSFFMPSFVLQSFWFRAHVRFQYNMPSA